jgi:pimeloyl-ACP methyl ester carboxylesterase
VTARHQATTVSEEVRPYCIDVRQPVLDRIRRRLIDAHWEPAAVDDAGWTHGTHAAWLRDFVAHWLTHYDWRAEERRLNRWPQFKTTVDGIDIHFYHVRGSATRPRPLLLTHGWPGSVVEFLGCIERLAHQASVGGDAEQGFDLVIPSLPGYGFSGAPPRPIGPRRVAALWRQLMTQRLGYERFVAQGGDWGAAVTSWLGHDHADVVSAIHLNMVASWAGRPSAEPSPAEAAYRARLARVQADEMGYYFVQSTKPQTVALALADSPLGFAAWVTEKFRSWGDTGGDIDSRFSRDTLITNLMTYLVNDAVGTAIWLYRGRADEAADGSWRDLRVSVPTGVALFPAEFIPYPPREIAERSYAIARWTVMAAGGHFAALEEPEAFSNEVRSFFASLPAS